MARAPWWTLTKRATRNGLSKYQRGSFASVPDLVTAIEDYIEHHNANPKPFVWTKTAAEITEKVKRGRVALEQARRLTKDTPLVPAATLASRNESSRLRASFSLMKGEEVAVAVEDDGDT